MIFVQIITLNLLIEHNGIHKLAYPTCGGVLLRSTGPMYSKPMGVIIA